MKVVIALILVMAVGKTQAWWFVGGDTVVQPTEAVNATCQALGRAGDCRFFTCFERRFPCGDDFYMKKFAQKYCTRFIAASGNFDAAGQRLLVASRQCVMTELLRYYDQDRMNCDTLENFALALIGPCYLENNFCEVINTNTQAFLDVFEFRDAGTMMGELVKIARTCGGSAMTNLMDAVSGGIGRRISNFFNFGNTA